MSPLHWFKSEAPGKVSHKGLCSSRSRQLSEELQDFARVVSLEPELHNYFSELTRSYERIITLGVELHEIYPKSVHDLGLRPGLPGHFIALPASRAN